MKPLAVAITPRSQALRALRNILNDAFYRGSLYLLVNAVATSVIGFVFWTLAAHRYSAPTVGIFSGVTSGATLLAAIAALGLPITMTRHIAGAEDSRGLVLVAVIIIATVGTILCLATVLLLGPHLPSALHIQQRGRMVLTVTVLVVFTAVGGTLDAGLVATRSSRVLLIKNIAGSIVKLVAMLLLATIFRSSGLLISFALGLVVATVLSGVALGRRIRGKSIGFRLFHMPWHYLSITSGNYLATVIGILPLSLVPIEVLAARGAAQTARFSIAFLIAGFLNLIPSTTGQVLFAEIARGGMPLGKQLRKALRAVYVLLLPSLALLLVAAPFVLRLFGQAYATDATGCLRVLALSALATGGTYLVDSLLIARDRTAAYTFMQIANAALVLGCVGMLLPRGLTAAACGWAFAQGLSLILGLFVLATGRVGRHHTVRHAYPLERAHCRRGHILTRIGHRVLISVILGSYVDVILGMRKQIVLWLTGSPLEGISRRAYSALWGCVPDTFLSAAALKGRDYDRMTIRIAARTLSNGGAAVDVGAHQGDILKALVKMSPGPHWAFEPLPAFATRLRKRFPSVTVVQAALSDYRGTAEFRFLPGAAAYSSLHVRPQIEADQPVQSLSVQVCRLDDCIPEDVQVAFLKIDVEGAEAAVLRGATQLMRRCQPVVVFECASAGLPACVSALEGTGLHVSFLADFLEDTARPLDEVIRAAKERDEYYYVASTKRSLLGRQTTSSVDGV